MVDLFHFCDNSDATCVLGFKIPEQKSMKPSAKDEPVIQTTFH